LAPIREKYIDLSAKPQIVKAALEQGAQKCGNIARQTIGEVRTVIGVR
jgi:hypothetical protein